MCAEHTNKKSREAIARFYGFGNLGTIVMKDLMLFKSTDVYKFAVLGNNFEEKNRRYFRSVAPDFPKTDLEEIIQIFLDRVTKQPNTFRNNFKEAMINLIKQSKRYEEKDGFEQSKIRKSMKWRIKRVIRRRLKHMLNVEFVEEYYEYFCKFAPHLPDNTFQQIVKTFFMRVKQYPSHYISMSDEAVESILKASENYKQDLKSEKIKYNTEPIIEDHNNVKEKLNQYRSKASSSVEDFVRERYVAHTDMKSVKFEANMKQRIKAETKAKDNIQENEVHEEFDYHKYFCKFALDLPDEEFEQIVENFFEKVKDAPNWYKTKVMKSLLNASDLKSNQNDASIEHEAEIISKDNKMTESEFDEHYALDPEYVEDCRLYMGHCAENLPKAEFESIMEIFFNKVKHDPINYIAIERVTLEKLEEMLLTHKKKIEESRFVNDSRLFMRFYAEDLPDAEFEPIMDDFFCQVMNDRSNLASIEDATLSKLKVAFLAHQQKNKIAKESE